MHKKGSLMGLLSGLFWGLDSVILGIALSYPVMESLGIKSSLVATFLHDTVSFLFLIAFLIKINKVDEFKKIIKSKSGLAIMGAALLGGPIGMGSYIMGIKYLGATLASSISAIYPAVGLVLAYIFLKERMKTHSIIGLIVAIVAIILMGISPDIAVNNLGLGITFIIFTIIGWGSEAVIINVALKDDVSSEVALTIRQMTSTITYCVVVMPLISYSSITPTIQSPMILFVILLSGLLGTISYLAYYKSIDLIGATQAMGLNISYPAWAFIFQYVVDGNFSFYLFILSIIVIIGSILSNDNPRELFRFK